MSEDYMRRRLPSGWSVFIEKSKFKSDVNILNHCSSLCFNNFSSSTVDNNEDLCLKRCYNKSLYFLDYFKAECDDLHVNKSKEFFNNEH